MPNRGMSRKLLRKAKSVAQSLSTLLRNDWTQTLRDVSDFKNFWIDDWMRTSKDFHRIKNKGFDFLRAINQCFLQVTGISNVSKAISSQASQKVFQKKLSKEFKGITIALVTLIQGLAFNDLATKLVSIIDKFNIVDLSGFILCFAILIRVTETYILAGIQYDEDWNTQAIDLLLMFIIGFVEYSLFSCVNPGKSDFIRFNYILSTFSSVGALTYYRVLGKVKRGELHANITDMAKKNNLIEIEKFTQQLNVILTGFVTFPCLLTIFISLVFVEFAAQQFYGLPFKDLIIITTNIANTVIISANILTSYWLSLKV
jgi:hypothetical protein